MRGESRRHPGRRLLGLFAHPDDEVFCVGGTFARAAEVGAETMVVSFTEGEAGRIRHADIATRSTLGCTRAGELAAACRELGVTDARCLEFPDGGLAAVERNRLVEAAVEIIRSFRPDVVYSFDETGAYGHPDHITMSKVSLTACRRAGDATAFPAAGDPFAPSALLHARFPPNERLLLRVLVDWLTGLDDRFRGTAEFTNALLMFADGSSMLGYACDHLGVEWFPQGSYVIEQGDPASSLYLILSGQVDVIVEDADGARSSRGSVGRGEFIGEIGIAAADARSAHCVALEDTACFVLSPAAPSRHAPHGTNAVSGAPSGSARAAGITELPIDLTIDVTSCVPRKVSALARHESQYAMAPGLFPEPVLHALLGTEYFFRAWTALEADQGVT